MEMNDVVSMLLKKPGLAAERLKNLVRGKFSKRYGWKDKGEIRQKDYETYDEYVKHQSRKLDLFKEGLTAYDEDYRISLRRRLEKDGVLGTANNVLCLAARLGTEVKSFLDLGCFALGIDLNPGQKNKYVVTGDFHDLQFPDRCVDVVFCNSLDHAYDLDKLMREVSRVLKDRGLLILEIVKGSAEGGKAGYWEALSWNKAEDVLQNIQGFGFETEMKYEFNDPWSGWHVVMRKKA